MKLKQITFSEIKYIWLNYLWLDRKSPIKPTNGLLLGGGWIKDIESNTPTFWGIFDNDKLIGVNSGHKAENNMYRSRGIYVFPEYRGQGIAQKLLKATEEQAKKENCSKIWSMPRESSLKTYLKFGFKLYSDNQAVGMEFGPNYYVIKDI